VWRDVFNSDSIAELYTDYIVTAAGFEFKYSAELELASGQTYSALIPGAYGVPYINNQLFNLRPEFGESFPFGVRINRLGSDGLEQGGPRPVNLEKLNSAGIVRIAPELGFSQVWHPSSLDAIHEWRPMRYAPIVYNTSFLDAMADTYGDGAGNPYWILPPVCPGDPNAFRAFWTRMMSTNPWVSSSVGSSTGIATPADLVSTTLYTGRLQTGTGAGLISANAAQMNSVLQNTMINFQSTLIGDGEATMVSVITGLPANKLVGTVTFVMNVTGLPETRTFRPVSAEAHGSSKRGAELALHAVQARPSVAMPPSDSANYEPKLAEHKEQGVQKVASTAKAVVESASSVADTISEILPVAETIGETLLAFFA
jgi:hypothetical protein